MCHDGATGDDAGAANVAGKDMGTAEAVPFVQVLTGGYLFAGSMYFSCILACRLSGVMPATAPCSLVIQSEA